MPRKKPKTAEEMFGPPVSGSVVAPKAKGKKTQAVTCGNTGVEERRPDGTLTANSPYAWKPGQSGNPNGRPKSTTEMKQRAASLTDLALDVIEMAAQLTRRRLEKAMEILAKSNATIEELDYAKAVLDKEGLAAAQALLDRGHGKPQQKVEVDLSSIFDEMDEEEVAEYLITAGNKVTADLLARRKARQKHGN